MSKHLMTAGITMALLVGLPGCSDFRRAVGTEKSSPDEFEVVVRPPLSLPPGFSDRPEDIIAAAAAMMSSGRSLNPGGNDKGGRTTTSNSSGDDFSVPTARRKSEQPGSPTNSAIVIPAVIKCLLISDLSPVHAKCCNPTTLRLWLSPHQPD